MENIYYPFVMYPITFYEIFESQHIHDWDEHEKRKYKALYLRKKLKETKNFLFDQCLLQDNSRKSIRRGVSEAFFATLIKEKLELFTFENFELFGATERSISPWYYHPDILVFDPESNILIDVEIDEPYSLEGNLPIHCFGNSNDNLRDTYFNEMGVTVLRFAEIQIVKYPERCLSLIRGVIDQVKQFDFTTAYPDSEKLVSEVWPAVYLEQMWSEEQALEWAEKGYRSDYLKENNEADLTQRSDQMVAEVGNELRSERRARPILKKDTAAAKTDPAMTQKSDQIDHPTDLSPDESKEAIRIRARARIRQPAPNQESNVTQFVNLNTEIVLDPLKEEDSTLHTPKLNAFDEFATYQGRVVQKQFQKKIQENASRPIKRFVEQLLRKIKKIV